MAKKKKKSINIFENSDKERDPRRVAHRVVGLGGEVVETRSEAMLRLC